MDKMSNHFETKFNSVALSDRVLAQNHIDSIIQVMPSFLCFTLKYRKYSTDLWLYY